MNSPTDAVQPVPPPSGRPALFVTGGSRGLGRALVVHLASRFNVGFGWMRSDADARTLFETVRDRGGWALPLRCDATDASEVQTAAEKLSALAGDCQTLIHTTGSFNEVRLDDTDPDTWREQLETTVTAGFIAWRAFAAQLRRHPRSRVIFVGDSAAEQLRARPQATGYYVGKHGLVLLARTIAAENQHSGLTCNVVSPGVLPNSIDLDRPGMKVNVEFVEIAGLIDFLLSPAADAVSGSHLIASRGWNV